MTLRKIYIPIGFLLIAIFLIILVIYPIDIESQIKDSIRDFPFTSLNYIYEVDGEITDVEIGRTTDTYFADSDVEILSIKEENGKFYSLSIVEVEDKKYMFSGIHHKKMLFPFLGNTIKMKEVSNDKISYLVETHTIVDTIENLDNLSSSELMYFNRKVLPNTVYAYNGTTSERVLVIELSGSLTSVYIPLKPGEYYLGNYTIQEYGTKSLVLDEYEIYSIKSHIYDQDKELHE